MSSIASSAGQPSTGNLGDEEPSLPKTLDNLDLRSYSLGRGIHERGLDFDLLSINPQAAASTAQRRELSTISKCDDYIRSTWPNNRPDDEHNRDILEQYPSCWQHANRGFK